MHVNMHIIQVLAMKRVRLSRWKLFTLCVLGEPFCCESVLVRISLHNLSAWFSDILRDLEEFVMNSAVAQC